MTNDHLAIKVTEIQLSSTNCATHLCNMQWRFWSTKITPLPTCVTTLQFGRVGISIGVPKLGSPWVPPPYDGECLAPCKRAASLTVYHVKFDRFLSKSTSVNYGHLPENAASLARLASHFSRSLKVVRLTETDRSDIYDFLLTFHSNQGPILCLSNR